MKTLRLAAIIAALLTLACKKTAEKKDWTCNCDVKATGSAQATKQTLEISTKEESDAKSQCDSFGSASVNGNGTWTCNVAAK